MWKRVREAFPPKDVKTYQQIILEERQAWQFISAPIKVKVISYWAKQHEINVKMLTEADWQKASGRSRIRTIPTQRPSDRGYQFYAALHESAIGTKRTSSCYPAMSAFGGKADVG